MRRKTTLFLQQAGSLDGFQIFVGLILIVVAVFMALPLIYIFGHAFKPINELFLYPPTFLPQKPTLLNFRELFLQLSGAIPFSRYLFNSIAVAAATVLGIVVISSMAAYGFSKVEFPGNRYIFSFVILALMFTPQAIAIPRFIVIANLEIMDTYLAHIVPYLAMPVAVFLLKQFVDQIPNELLDAAKIDGAREWTIFSRLIIPMCIPATATVCILAFQLSWSNGESSQFYVDSEAIKTLPYYVETLSQSSTSVAGKGVAAAGTLLVLVPSLIIFLLFQRKVMLTMISSGIK